MSYHPNDERSLARLAAGLVAAAIIAGFALFALRAHGFGDVRAFSAAGESNFIAQVTRLADASQSIAHDTMLTREAIVARVNQSTDTAQRTQPWWVLAAAMVGVYLLMHSITEAIKWWRRQ
jgi:uncharacterized membrane protein YdcZ (DUF606 family)